MGAMAAVPSLLRGYVIIVMEVRHGEGCLGLLQNYDAAGSGNIPAGFAGVSVPERRRDCER
jgi:hypothetical protein